MSRTITVVLEIKDQDKANTIWDAHRDGEQFAGCKVKEIHNGNATKDVGGENL